MSDDFQPAKDGSARDEAMPSDFFALDAVAKA
jgi:hypothetical protein